MNRLVISQKFRLEDYVVYPCPRCGKTSLKHDPNRFSCRETAESIQRHKHWAWDPEQIEELFTSVLVCDDPACSETVVCTGIGSVEFDIVVNDQDEQEQEYFSIYEPKTFTPPLKFIIVPSKCPESVRENLEEAFALTLLSPSSAANKVRAAVENLLNEFRVPKTTISKKQGNTKRVFLPLASRIQKASSKSPALGRLNNIMTALRWLGNEGSHATSAIITNDVFDAYTLIEHLLNEIYPPNADIQKTAKRIIKNKGVSQKNKK